MARPLARRQFWVLVFLAAIAYLWWRSLEPGRYVEMPSDPAGDAAANPALAAAAPESWAMSERDYLGVVSTELGRQLRLSCVQLGDTLVVDAQWRVGGSLVRHTRAGLVADFQPAWLTVAHGSDADRTVDVRNGVVTVTEGTGDTSVVPWALQDEIMYEDLIFIQAERWRGVADTGRVVLVTFAERGAAVTPVDVSVWAEDSSTVVIQTNNGDRLELGYWDGQPPLQRYCDATGACYQVYLVESGAGGE